jgi:hypothetical protein
MRAMNVTREQLVSFFGSESGLRRYENMLAEQADVIEGEAVEQAVP